MADLNPAASWDGETRSVTSEDPWVDRKEFRDICLSKTTSVHPGKTQIYTFRNSLSSPRLAGHIFNSPAGMHFVSSDVIQLRQTLPDKKTQRNSIESVEISSMMLAGLPHQGHPSPDVARKPVHTMATGGQKQTEKPQVRPVRLPPAPPPPRSTSLQSKAQTEPPKDPDFVPQLLRHALLDDSPSGPPSGQTGTMGSEPGTNKDERSQKGGQLTVIQRGDDQSESSVDSDVSSDEVSMTLPVPKSGTRFFTAKDRDVDFSKRLSNKLSEPLPGDEEGEETHKTKRGHNPLKRFFARKKGKYDPSADLQFSHSVLPSLDSDVLDAKKKKKNSPKNENKKSYDPTKDKEARKPEVQKSKLTKDSIVVIKSSGKCLTDVSIDMSTVESDTRDGHSEKLVDSDEEVTVTDVSGPRDIGDDESDNRETDASYKTGNDDDDDSDQNEIYANFPTVQRRKTAGVVMNEPAKLSTFFAPVIPASTGGNSGEVQEEEKEDTSSSSSSDEDEQGSEADRVEENDDEEIYVNALFIPKLNRQVSNEPARNVLTPASRLSDQSSDKSVRTASYVVNRDPDFHEKTIAGDEKIKVTATNSADVTECGLMESKLSKSDIIEPRLKVSLSVSETYSQVEKSSKKELPTVSSDETASPGRDDSPEINEPLKRFGTMENLAPDDSHVIMSDVNTEVNVEPETAVGHGPNNVASNVRGLIPTAAHNADKPSKKVEKNNEKCIQHGVETCKKEKISTSSIEHIERFLGLDGETTMKKSLLKTEKEYPPSTMSTPAPNKLLYTPSKVAETHGVHAQDQNKIINCNLEADASSRVIKSHQSTVEKERIKTENANCSLQTIENVRNVDSADDTINVSKAEIKATADTIHASSSEIQAMADTVHASGAEIQVMANAKSAVQAPEKPQPKGIYSIIKSRANPPAVITTKSSSVNTRNDPSLDAIKDSRSAPSIPKRPTTIATKPSTAKATSPYISPKPIHTPISTSASLVQPPNTPTSQPIPSHDHPIPGTSPSSNKPSRPPPTKPKPPTWKMKTMIRKFESPESGAPSSPTKPGAPMTTRGSEEKINKDLIAGVLKELDDYIDTDLTGNVNESKHAESSADVDVSESVVSLQRSDVNSQVYERFIVRFPDPPDCAKENLDHVDSETKETKEGGEFVMRGGKKDLRSTDPGQKTNDHDFSVQPRVETAKYEDVVDWDLSTITSAKALISHQEKMSDNSRREKGEEMSSLTSKMADRGYDDVVDKITDEKAEKIYDEIREANGDESPTSKCFKFNWKKRDAAVSEPPKTDKVKTKDDNKEKDKKKVKIHKGKTAKERTRKEKNGPDGKHREKTDKKRDKGKKHGVKGRSLSNSSSNSEEDGSASSSQKSGSSSSLQPSSEDSEYEVVGSPEITKLRGDRDVKDLSLKENLDSVKAAVEPLKDPVHGADSYGYEIPATYSIKRYDAGNVKLSSKDDTNRDVIVKSDSNANEIVTPDVKKAKNVLGDLAKDKAVLENSRFPDHDGMWGDKENSQVGDSEDNLIPVEAGSVESSDARLHGSDWSTGNVAINKPVSVRAEPTVLNSTLEAGFNVTHLKQPEFDSKENSQKCDVTVGVESRDITRSHRLAKDPAVKTSTKSPSKSVTGVLVAQPHLDRPKADKPRHHGSSSRDTSSTSEDSDSDGDERNKKSHKRKDTNKINPTVNITGKFDATVKEKVTSPKNQGRDEIKQDVNDKGKQAKKFPGIEDNEKFALPSISSLNERPVLLPSVAVNDKKVKTADAKLNSETTVNIKTGTLGHTPKDLHSTDMKVGQLEGADVSQSIAQKYQSQSVQGEQMAIHLQAPNIKTSETKSKEVGFPGGEKSKSVPTNLLMSQGDEATPRNDAELSVLEIPDVHSMSELDEDPWKDYSALELGKNTRDLSPRQLPRLGDGANNETTDGRLLDVPDKTSHVMPDTADRSRSLPPDHAAPPVPRIRSSLQMTNESVDLSDLSSAKVSFNNKLKTDATPAGIVKPDMEIYSDGTSEPGTLAINEQRIGVPDAVIGSPLKPETITIKGGHHKNDGNHLKIETETRERQYDQLPVRMRKSGNATSTLDMGDAPALLFFESPRLPLSSGSKGKNPAEKSDYAEPWEEKKFEELPPLQPAFINSRSSSEYSGNSANQARMSLTSEDLHPASVIDFKVGTMNRSTSLDQVPGGKPSRRTKTPDDGKKGISLSSLSSLFHRNKKDKKGSKTDDGDNESDNLSDNHQSDDDGRPEKIKQKKEKHKKAKSTSEHNKKPEKRKSDKDKPVKVKKPAKPEKGQRSSLIDQPDDMEMAAEGMPLCRLLRVNEDGSRDVELTRPQSEPLGIFFSKGRETKKDGLVVKSFLDKHAKKLFAGILRVGDEIIEIDESDICPLTLDEVKDIIQQKERMVIKLCPLEGGERTMNLTSSGPL